MMVLFYFMQLRYLKMVYGAKKQRKTWDALKRLTSLLINDKCLAQMSWSGKGAQNKKTKTAVNGLKKICGVLKDTISFMNDEYTDKAFQTDMKESVLKYAYTNALK